MRSEEFTTAPDTVAPSRTTFAPATKPVPPISTAAGEPAPMNAGETDETTGTGFSATLTVKLRAFETPPPGAGFVTAIDCEPGAVGLIEAVSVRLSTKLVSIS